MGGRQLGRELGKEQRPVGPGKPVGSVGPVGLEVATWVNTWGGT